MKKPIIAIQNNKLHYYLHYKKKKKKLVVTKIKYVYMASLMKNINRVSLTQTFLQLCINNNYVKGITIQ